LLPKIAEASLDANFSLVAVERQSVTDAFVCVRRCLTNGSSDPSQCGPLFDRGGTDVLFDALRGRHEVSGADYPSYQFMASDDSNKAKASLTVT
jgi:hypothetical protein